MAMIGLIAWQMATTSTSSEAAPEDCTPGPSPESNHDFCQILRAHLYFFLT